MKEYENAKKAFGQSIRIEPGYAMAHNNLGNVLLVWNDFDGAIKCFEDALRIDPSNAIVKGNLARALKLTAESPFRVAPPPRQLSR
jgi:tetratricopeptide (TPR) repeat protein